MLGMGIRLNMLGGDKETVESFTNAIGKTIKRIELDSANELKIWFTDNTGIKMFDDGQSCCETRFMCCDDDLAPFIGGTLIGAEIADGPDLIADGPDLFDGCEEHNQQFLKVTTSKGVFTVVNHNEHNGYYGGFDIVVRNI